MKLRTPQGPRLEDDYFAFGGGLDQVTPPMAMPPGRLLECLNWDIPATGGYRRLPGYERYDGRAKPSDASAVLIQATTTFDAGLAVGDSINGQTSGATGVVAYIAADRTYIAATKVVGTFTNSENIREGVTVVATATGFTLAISGATTNAIAAGAADIYRADIAKPAGSGAIRGVWEYNSERYCWRDNAGGTAGVMFKATTSGWTAVTLAEEVYFSNANTSVGVGDTLTQGGVTATIRKVVVQTGSLLSGTNTGKLVISARAGGNFAAGAATSTGGGSLTISGAQTAQTFPAGGKYRFRNTNFGGATATFAMYGCNGVGRAFEFDGTYLTFIDTGMTADTPSHVAIFKNHLVLAFDHSVQHAAPGEPFVWSVVMGAAELTAGDDVTNMVETTDALIVLCKNKTLGLQGYDVTSWLFPTLLEKIGARTDTAQIVAQPVFLDDLGITTLAASQAYGNFAGSQISELIKTYLTDRIDSAAASLVSRVDRQYHLFFTDGSGLRITFDGAKVSGAMPFTLPAVANVACEGESTGVLLLGATDGYVYELNRGRSFDGASIDHRIRLAWNFSRSPRLRKEYRRVIFDVNASSYGSFTVNFLAGRNDPDIETTSSDASFTGGSGVGWDDPSAGWDVEFGWDGDSFTRCGIGLDVTATDISFSISGQSDDQLPFTVSGQLLEFVPRRKDRRHS